MGSYVWCAIGAALGWLAGTLGAHRGITERLESLGVGIFGAFIGGEFLSAMFLTGKPGLNPAAISLGVGGALVSLLFLRLLRRAVGPLKAGKARRRES